VKPPVKRVPRATPSKSHAQSRSRARDAGPTTAAQPPRDAAAVALGPVMSRLAPASVIPLGLIALMPRRFLRRLSFLRRVGDRELRLGALGAGAAVLLGVIVANLI
jgi:hypothetical protein